MAEISDIQAERLLARAYPGLGSVELGSRQRQEIEKWLITIEAHCTVIADPDVGDDPVELAKCIKVNVAEIRSQLVPQ